MSQTPPNIRVWCSGFAGEFLSRQTGESVGKGVPVNEGRKAFVERGFAGEVCGGPRGSGRHCLHGHFEWLRQILG